MDLWVTLGVLVKRWYITLPLLALTGLLAVQVGSSIEPTYSATATAEVNCPSETEDPVTGEIKPANPFCNDSATSQLTRRGAVHLSSSRIRRSVADQGLLPDYQVDDNDAPLLYITAEGDNEDEVISTLTATMGIFENYTTDIQPEGVFKYTAEAFDVPDQASMSSSKTRTQIIIVVAGLILTTVLVHLFDAAALALKKRRGGGEEAQPAEAGGDDSDGPAAAEAAAPTTLESARRRREPETTDWDEAEQLLDDESQRLLDEGGMSSGAESQSRWGR